MPKDRKGNEIKPPKPDKYNDKDQENDRNRIKRENEEKRKK